MLTTKTKMVSFKIPVNLLERLNRLAEETNRPKSFYMRLLLEEYLEELEDIYLSEATLERIRAGKEKLYSLEEAEEEFGL